MSRRPAFLTVTYSGSGLNPMDYERKMVREKNVKFDGEDGTLEVTDIRLVWIKKPSRWGAVKKVGAVAGAIAAAVAVDALGDAIGGRAGRAVSRVGWHVGAAMAGVAITHMALDSFYNRDEHGNMESIAIPIIAISQAAQSGDRLIVELKSGGTVEFKFKQKKVIPTVIANITSAQQEGKCPYCGASTMNSPTCPNCGAPIDSSATGGPSAPAGGGKFCTKCGQPLPADARFCSKCGAPVS